jgi:hypothetical protein
VLKFAPFAIGKVGFNAGDIEETLPVFRALGSKSNRAYRARFPQIKKRRVSYAIFPRDEFFIRPFWWW